MSRRRYLRNDGLTMHLSLSRAAGVRRILTTCVVALLLLGAPHAAGAQAAADAATATSMVVNTDATFVRDAPNVRATVVTRLERGARVQILDRSAGDWWRVRGGDPPVEGYVHRLVLTTAPVQPARPALPPTPRPVPEPAPEEQAGDVEPARPPGTGTSMLASGGVGLFFPAARDTFDAVGITGNPLAYGGTVEAVRLWRSLFVRGSVEWTSETGERVFLTDDGQRFPLGIPLDVDMLPIDFSAGWRFDGRRARPAPIVPYVGGGVGLLRYRETDPFAEEDEDIDERFLSYNVLAGVDVYLHRMAGARVEYRFRHVPDSLGEGGASAATGDTSLGGSVLFFGIVLGR